jgi:conjugative transfer signal peptidase TraF
MEVSATLMRTRLAAFVIIGAAAALLALGTGARDILLYNATNSMPVGFYRRNETPPLRGAIVTVRARDVARAYAASRGFDDAGDRFLKRVAATAGDCVCAEGENIVINGSIRAHRARRDSRGAPLPWWNGCRRLGRGELFLLGDAQTSFDSRYFGPVRASAIEGVWTRL